MADDINMPATVRALSTAAKVGKSDRQQRENERRRKRKRQKDEMPVEDLIEIESNPDVSNRQKRKGHFFSGNTIKKPVEKRLTKVDIKI